MTQANASLKELLASVVTAMGYEFVGCELQRQGRGSVVRVFIDSPEGITVDDCSKVSYQVSAMMDVEDPIQGQYTLEISSPGLERPLFEIEHFKKFIGRKVKVRLAIPRGDRRNMVGIVTKVDGKDIHLSLEGTEIVVPFSEIEKAKLVVDINVG